MQHRLQWEGGAADLWDRTGCHRGDPDGGVGAGFGVGGEVGGVGGGGGGGGVCNFRGAGGVVRGAGDGVSNSDVGGRVPWSAELAVARGGREPVKIFWGRDGRDARGWAFWVRRRAFRGARRRGRQGFGA